MYDEWQKELDRLNTLSELAQADVARLEQKEPSLDLIKAHERVIDISAKIQAHLKSKYA